jgi:tetratricopeptide (TPR) repeat protein
VRFARRKVGGWRERLPWAAVFVLHAVLILCVPMVCGQVSNFAPASRALGSTVSVRDFQIPAKAKREFQQGLKRLQKRDFHGSLLFFDKALQIYPNYYEAHYNEGVAHMGLGRDAQAGQSFQKAIDLSGGQYVRAVFGYGLVLCHEGRPGQAERIVRQGLELYPGIPDGHIIAAIALVKLHRLDEAEKDTREALRLPPSSESRKAYLVLADIHAEQAHYDAMATDLETYLRLATDDNSREDLQNLLAVARKLAAKAPATNSTN